MLQFGGHGRSSRQRWVFRASIGRRGERRGGRTFTTWNISRRCLAPRRKLGVEHVCPIYLSESGRAGRKVFFDFATLPERAISACHTDSSGCPVRFNG